MGEPHSFEFWCIAWREHASKQKDCTILQPFFLSGFQEIGGKWQFSTTVCAYSNYINIFLNGRADYLLRGGVAEEDHFHPGISEHASYRNHSS